jgi:hypothetical protein
MSKEFHSEYRRLTDDSHHSPATPVDCFESKAHRVSRVVDVRHDLLLSFVSFLLFFVVKPQATVKRVLFSFDGNVNELSFFLSFFAGIIRCCSSLIQSV